MAWRNGRAMLMAGMATLLVVISGHAHASSKDLPDPRVISAAELGAMHTGITGAGRGLPSRTPNFGFEAGIFVIQPRFLLEGAFSTNFFKVDADNPGVDTTGVFSFHLRPGLAIFNPSYDWLAFQFKTDLDVLLPVSGKDEVTRQTNVGLVADLTLNFFPREMLSFAIFETFRRDLLVRPLSGSTAAHRNHNSVGADISFHPGGQALDFTLGYRFKVQRFDELTDYDTNHHDIKLVASWRFLPLNYAFFETDFEVYQYTSRQGLNPGNYADGMPLKLYLGFSGYLTERIAVLARAGFGHSLLEGNSEDFVSFIGQAEATFRFSPRTALTLGVSRDFQLAAAGGQMGFVRAYTSFEQAIGDIVLIHADFQFDYRVFGFWQPDIAPGATAAATTSDGRRKSFYLTAGLLADFNISRVFGASVGYRFEGDITDFAISSGGTALRQGYQDHRVYATLNLRY